MKPIRLIAICLLVFILCQSCTQKPTVENAPEQAEQPVCDSIIYELPNNTTISILQYLKDKHVSYCYLTEGEEDKSPIYSFVFPYDDTTILTKRDSILINQTNRFLKVENKYYPVLLYFDILFSNIPIQGYAINDFNTCTITINSRGEFLYKHAW